MKFVVIAAAACLAAGPAFAVDVTREAAYTGAPDAVWTAIGPWCAIGSWHPAVASCTETTVDGKPRRLLALKDGGEILEEEVARDDAAHTYTYRIVESPLPVQRYESTLRLDGNRIVWSGTFEAKDATDAVAEETIAGIYTAGLDGITAALK